MNGRIRGDISLNVPVTRDDASDEMQDWLVDPAPGPEALLTEVEDRNRMRTALKDALARLTARERHIINARFLAEQPTTLEDLGATFGVSRERIRQIEVRALQKAQERSARLPRRNASCAKTVLTYHVHSDSDCGFATQAALATAYLPAISARSERAVG